MRIVGASRHRAGRHVRCGWSWPRAVHVHQPHPGALIVTLNAPAAKRFVKVDARTYERNVPQELAVFELVDYKLAR
jgi:hypothetical protein